MILFSLYQTRKINYEINNSGVSSTARVLDIIEKKKGILTSEKIALIEFQALNDIIKKRVPFQPNMEIGKCYEIIYSESNTNFIKVNVSKEIHCLD